MAVSLRLPDEMKRRVARLSIKEEMTAHAFMLAAIREKLDLVEADQAFRLEAERRLARMKKDGRGIPAQEVFDHLHRRALGKPSPRPKARRLR